MSREHQIVLEKARKRFEILKAIYFDTEGKTNKTSISDEISKETNIPSEELVHVLQYLKDEELIHPLTMLHRGEGRIPIRILHKGVLEVEAAISKPNEPTEHFPAQIFNITNNAPVAAQQFGDRNTLNDELRQAQIYQDAQQEGRQEERQQMLSRTVPVLLSAGLSIDQIAQQLQMDVEAVRRAMQPGPRN